MNYDLAATIVSAVSVKLGVNLTLGYIGNVDRFGDDRAWTVWVDGVRNVDTNNNLSLGYRKTEDLGDLVDDLETKVRAKLAFTVFSRPRDWKFTRETDAFFKETLSASEAKAAAFGVFAR